MIYLIKNINDIKNDQVNDFFYKINDVKKKKINNISNLKKKKQSIIGEILLSQLLKDNYNIDYTNLEFYFNDFGKPYIKNVNNIFFNISHSENFVGCVLSNLEVGIDIEKIRKTNINIINFFATESEKEYILNDKKDIYKRIFQIWTLKEAYFKMLGFNLFNMKSVEFFINNKEVTCSDKSVIIMLKEYENYIFAIVEKKKD